MNLKWLRMYLASYPIENKFKKKEGEGNKPVFIKLYLHPRDNSVVFILISLYFQAVGIFFNLTCKIRMTSVYSVEIHDCKSQMQNRITQS